MSKNKKTKKYNIILDLDQTCISSEDKDRFNFTKYKLKMNKFNYAEMDDLYFVFGRPNLQFFLDFLFKNVSVWTAATKDYAMFIIEHFILNGKENRKLDYVFHSDHCDISQKVKQRSKDLSLLNTYYKLNNFNNLNTLIIDDYDEVYETQPNNCIAIEPFEFKHTFSFNDRVLNDIMTVLKKILKHSNLSESINEYNQKNMKKHTRHHTPHKSRSKRKKK